MDRNYHFRQVARKGFTEKVTFEYRLKGDEEVSFAGVQGKSIPRKRTASAKCPEARKNLVCLRDNEGAWNE